MRAPHFDLAFKKSIDAMTALSAPIFPIRFDYKSLFVQERISAPIAGAGILNSKEH
ncbi:hypothetical protein CLV96_2657 [Leptospira meyeri]|uniref:Uncharacterized protein n=1 Tax=Leptospira meyeri TaxID=29508 RepID=A0A4R8N185_LEPME|nr:hypothetical protein CLV96_2657 [Leptospira meyeri]